MKSRIAAASPSPDSYPALKKYTSEKGSFVVLFSEKKTGVVVHTDMTANPVGLHSSSWSEEKFFTLPPSEIVQLSN